MAKFYCKRLGHTITEHIKCETKRNVLGTKKYLSINVLDHVTPSRRDDLISICYVLFEFAIGKLPWKTSALIKEMSHFSDNNEGDQRTVEAKAKEIKRKYPKGLYHFLTIFDQTSDYNLGQFFLDEYPVELAGLEELCDIYDYCQDLEFDAEPDYSTIKDIIMVMIDKQGDSYSPTYFDWNNYD